MAASSVVSAVGDDYNSASTPIPNRTIRRSKSILTSASVQNTLKKIKENSPIKARKRGIDTGNNSNNNSKRSEYASF
jgi:hypothetical protein